MSFFVSPAFAADDAAVVSATSAAVSAESIPYELSADKMMRDNLLMLGVLFFIFYFLLIRPQQKRIKSHVDMIKALKKGDKVITSGGIIGSVARFEGDDVAVVEIAQGVQVKLAKSSITEVVGDKSSGKSTANDN